MAARRGFYAGPAAQASDGWRAKLSRMEVAVVGAGIVGCAIASALARRGRDVVVLERAARVGTGITSRNSGVIHSGLYYPPGSLKAETCVRGQALLYAWASTHGVAHACTGKLVVARDELEVAALAELHANAAASGAGGLAWLDAAELARRAPSLPPMRAALWCERTGIIDAMALTASLRADAERHGASFVLQAELLAVNATATGFRVETTRGELEAGSLVNAAGLESDRVAALMGLVDPAKIYPCRGDYFRLHAPGRYQHLVYPVRRRDAAGLGVHLTLELDGGVRLGPDAEYVASRDDFGPAEHKHADFLAAAQALLGPIAPLLLRYDGCGIRPKLRAPDEREERDFMLCEGPPGCVHLIGVESPGLTAALALAERVVGLL
ncbi:NAD(P)/FAD-dependent oxidoreductase [Nannocystis sp.]